MLSSPATAAKPLQETGRARVLLVDDDERNLLALSEVLRPLADVVAAPSGKQALRELMKEDFAVILLDVFMPEMDGYETARLIRQRNQTTHIPIIFLSAVNKETEHLIRGYSMGAVDYVFKPVDPVVLRSKVAVFVDLFLLRQQVAERVRAEQELRERHLRGERERLQVEKELQHTRLRQAAMLDTLPLALYEATLDERGRLVRRIIGGNLGEIAGDDAAALTSGELCWEERIATEDSADLDSRCQGYTEPTRAAHYRWNRSDGTTIHILDQCVQTGEDDSWVGTLFDVTAQHELEQQLVQARKSEALGQLTGGVAHDFNNLLAAVLGGLRLLEGRVKFGDREKRIVEHMRHAAESGADLVRRLMAFARKQELRPTSVDPRTLCKTVAALAEHTLGPKISVRWRYPKHGPWLFVDKTQLELSLVNLLINARDAMPAGGVIDVVVEETGRPAGSAGSASGDQDVFLQIRVRDQGNGIPPRLLERVTEPFFTTKGTGEGTGLGLSMVAGFVAQSGGALRIDSEPGAGTEIAMILPATRTQEHRATKRPETTREISVGSVLLVDDDERVREILGEQLRDLGLEVTVAEDAEQALDWLEQEEHRPEFVLTDFSMPGLDGMEFLAVLRRRWPAIKGAIMTGNPRERLAQDTINVPIVHKPIDLPDLKRLLAEC
jgi:signal transduction histidine kinase